MRCKTVGELIKALRKFPPNAGLIVDGPDSGGYDVTWLNTVEVKLFNVKVLRDAYSEKDLKICLGDDPFVQIAGVGKEWFDIARQHSKEIK